MNEHSGRLVPPKDVDALTAALDEVLSLKWSPEEIYALHSRSWSDVAYDLLTIFEDLLGRRVNPNLLSKPAVPRGTN